MMNYLLLSYSALIIYVYMGISFWKCNPKGKINILFLILSLILAYCSLIQVFECYLINEKVTLYFMDQISEIGWLNYSGVLLWICLIIVEEEKYISRKLFKVIIFSPGILFTIFELFVNGYSLRMTKIVIYFA